MKEVKEIMLGKKLQPFTSTSPQQNNYLRKPTNYHRHRKIIGKSRNRNVALWIDYKDPNQKEDGTPFRFTGKERDPETGLYYYGARYLDPKTSRWLGVDPAMGEYVPSAPVNEDVKKRNGNLPGMGGVFNTVNMHVYHYAGNNPVKYTDPDGEEIKSAARTFMSSCKEKLGFGNGTIDQVGCVLTAYTRIASSIFGREISLANSNKVAKERSLFENENLLFKEKGAVLINAMIDSPRVRVNFIGSFELGDNNLEAYASLIDSYENNNGEFYLTGRINTFLANGDQTGHTVNINPNSIVRNENGSVSNIMINDTVNVRKQILDDPSGRKSTLTRIDVYQVIRLPDFVNVP